MKNIMKRAWEIAKSGQQKFGGRVSEYFAQSLSLAWKEVRSMNEQKEAIAKLMPTVELIRRYEKEVPLSNGFDVTDFDQLDIRAKENDTYENAMIFAEMMGWHDELAHSGWEHVENGEITNRQLTAYMNRLKRFTKKYADKALLPDRAAIYK